jgi:hypothetical protein
MRISQSTISQLAALTILLSWATPLAARNINWSGYNWWVRTSNGNPQGPGPNIFSDSTNTVFVDHNGDLHLRIHQENGKWVGAEIDNHQSLSYGTYEWEVSSRYDQFAANVVGGLFTYLDPYSAASQTSGSVGNGIADTPHEIDIEFTKAWGNANLWHTTHDPDVQSPHTSYLSTLSGTHTTHRFTWEPDRITWGSYHGHVAGVANPANPMVGQPGGMAVHTYTGPVVPKDLNEIPIINFWLSGNNVSNIGPTNGQMQEMIIHSFSYTPLADPLISADFDGDSDVDGADFLIWQRGLGVSGGAANNASGNADGDTDVDGDDLMVWTSLFGAAIAISNAAPIPEPAGLLVIVLAGWFGARMSRRLAA